VRIAAAAILTAAATLVAVGTSCGDRSGPAERADAASGLSEAAERVMRSIDANDADGFAAVSADPKDARVEPLKPEAVAAGVADLHERYGVRARTIRVESVDGDRGRVVVAFAEHETALLLEFRRNSGGPWRLVNLSETEPTAAEPSSAAPTSK
jgi:hypothetical protein